LSRNPVHLFILAEECEKAGVELHFVTEPLDHSPEGQLIGFVKGYAAQIEREKIRERTVRGKRARAIEGKLPQGTGRGAFGYRYERGTGRRPNR
jgi:site-specific DNA recombinase